MKTSLAPLAIPIGLLLCFGVAVFAEKPPEKQAYMVWGNSCIISISKGLNTRIEVPMRDGKPVMKEAKILGIQAEYISNCGRIEIRKEQ